MYICRDTDENQAYTLKLLDQVDLKDAANEADISVVRYLSSALSIRCAQLLSAGIMNVLSV